MNQDIVSLRRSYSRLSDDKIRSLVDKDLQNLRSVGLQVLKEEVVKRNLPLVRSIDEVLICRGQIRSLITEKCNEIRDLSCPICGSEEHKLNAISISTVTFAARTKAFHIGCFNCLMKKKDEARDKNTLLNRRGLSGVLEAHRSLVENDKAMKELQVDKPSSSLWQYASSVVQQEFKAAMSEINVHCRISQPPSKYETNI